MKGTYSSKYAYVKDLERRLQLAAAPRGLESDVWIERMHGGFGAQIINAGHGKGSVRPELFVTFRSCSFAYTTIWYTSTAWRCSAGLIISVHLLVRCYEANCHYVTRSKMFQNRQSYLKGRAQLARAFRGSIESSCRQLHLKPIACMK